MKPTDASAPFLLKPREEVYFSAVAYLRPELDLGWECFCRLENELPEMFVLTLFNPVKVGRWNDQLLVGFYRESFHPSLSYGRIEVNDLLEPVKILEQYEHFGFHSICSEFIHDLLDYRVQPVTFERIVVFGKHPHERLGSRQNGVLRCDGLFTAFGLDSSRANRIPFSGSYAEYKFRQFSGSLTQSWDHLNPVV